MGNNRTSSFARVASILGPAAPIRRPRANAGLLVSALLALAITSGRSDESGIVIYTTLDQGRDETAIAVPFVKAERFALVTNVTTTDGKTVRVTNNQMKEIVHPPDLSRATVVDEAGIAAMRQRLAAFQALQLKFPRVRVQIDPVVNELGRVLQLLEAGNVLVTGRLLSREDYERQAAASRTMTVDLTVNGVEYKGARLRSVTGEKFSIMHSGGVTSLSVRQLSDDQIARLNGTSSGAVIEKAKEVARVAATASMENADARILNAHTPTPGPTGPSPPDVAVTSNSSVPSAGISGMGAGNTAGPPEVGLVERHQYSVSGSLPDIDIVAELLHKKQQEAARRLAQKGRQLQVRSAQSIAEQTLAGVAEFLAYDIAALVASNVIDNFGDDASRQLHWELMNQLANARTDEAASGIKKQMKDHAQKYYTGDIDELHGFGASEVGQAQMRSSLSDVMTRALTHVAFRQETRSRQGVQVLFQRDLAGIMALSEDEMLDFHAIFDILTRMDIAEALQSGEWGKVDLSILGDANAQDSYKQHFMAADHRSGAVLGRQLEAYNTAVAADATLTNSFSEMDERDFYRGVVPRLIEEGRQRSRSPVNVPAPAPSFGNRVGTPAPNRYDTGDPELERRLIEEDRVQSRIFGVSEEEMIRLRKGIIEKMATELSK